MKKLVNILFLFFFASCVTGQSLEQKMDELLNAYAKQNKLNGTVLVAQKGNIIYQKGFGWRDADKKIANDANSIFQIGSITKQITAAVIMQLQQEGKLSLQDKLSKYIQGFTNGDQITIEHLLTHTSGIYNYTNDTAVMNSDVTKHYSQAEMIKLFASYPPDFEPGSKWNYSNSAYALLGYIIEKVENKSYERSVRERIFQPLAMTNSGFDFTHLKNDNKTKGYFAITQAPVAAPIVDSTIAYSAGAVYSTVADLYKWERSIYTNRILKSETWKMVFTPYKNKYGYGWGIDTLYEKQFTAHSGGIHGYASYIIRFPQEELVVIAFDNSSSRELSKISKALAAVVLNKPYEVPAQKKEIKLDATVLKQYEGEYQLAPGFSITVFLEGNVLKAQATGQSAFELFAEKENMFFLKVVDAKVEFIKDEKGNVTELILYQNGQQPRGKKIK